VFLFFFGKLKIGKKNNSFRQAKKERRAAMSDIALTSQEVEMLRNIIQRYLPELRREIADTEKKEFKKFLEGMEAFMADFLKRSQ
jgi:hypothetical protein